MRLNERKSNCLFSPRNTEVRFKYPSKCVTINNFYQRHKLDILMIFDVPQVSCVLASL